MFTWQHLIQNVEAMGYTGASDDLDAVKSFLGAHNHSTETVTISDDGETVKLTELFAARQGRPLDMSSAAKAAADEQRISAMVDERVESIAKNLGLDKSSGSDGGSSEKHDVKVGRERLADDPTGGYGKGPRAWGDFCKDVIVGSNKELAKPSKLVAWEKASLSTYGNEGTGADGGFAVPEEFMGNIDKLVEAEDSLMSRCSDLPISGGSISLPDDETTPWGTSGVQAYWENEAGAYGQSKPSLKQKTFKPRKLTVLCPMTEEVLEDATALGAYVNEVAPERIAWEVDEAIVRGDGSGKPLGFLNSGALVTQAAVGSQTADTISGANVIAMMSRLYSKYRGDAVWLVSHDAEVQLMKLSQPGQAETGAANTNYGFALYSPPGLSRDGGQYGTLLNAPVIVTEHAATVGDLGDIMLCSFSQYRCVKRSQGVQAAQSAHLWFDQDAIAFKFRIRVDGAPKLSTTITPRSGSNTLSSFVTLAAR